MVGYGESSPLSLPISEPETITTGMSFLSNHVGALVGVDVSLDVDVTTLYPSSSHPVSRIGLESAYLDLTARVYGLSMRQIFGSDRDRVPLGESASLRDSTEEVIHEVRSFIDRGAKRIKVKIAPGRDVEIVDAIRRSFPDLELGADANAAYGPADIDLLANLAPLDLAFIEQPFSADDLDSHATLRERGLRVCLDESVHDLESCRRAIDRKACDMVNIKPARIGSFKESRAIHDECMRAGIRIFGGGRLETGIGKTTNAAFYSLPGFTDASDITPPTEYLTEDLIDPSFAVTDGMYTIPDSPGIGVSVNENTLRKFEKERVVFGERV